jgi:hypothetical protein
MSRIVKKIWIISRPRFTKADALLLNGLDCEYKMTESEPEEIHLHNQTYQYVGTIPKLTIVTTSDRQEDMLKLKYGDELLLLQVYHEVTYKPWTKIP